MFEIGTARFPPTKIFNHILAKPFIVLSGQSYSTIQWALRVTQRNHAYLGVNAKPEAES